MKIAGRIREINPDKKYFTMLIKNKVVSFYIQNNLYKKFQGYLFNGSYVFFEYSNELRYIDKRKVHTIKHFFRITHVLNKRESIVFYNIETIRKGVKEFLNGNENKMFLDFEMTMIDYDSPPFFKSEIIQAGIIIVDKDELVMYEKQIQIKPTKFKWVNRRTLNFAKLTKEDINNALPYKAFYEEFEGLINKFDPIVFIWGKNDVLALNDSYIINKEKPIPIVFSNLMQVLKNYFNLKNDPGLFTTLKCFTNEELQQTHSSLHDALVTKIIYEEFKKVVDGKKEIPKFV